MYLETVLRRNLLGAYNYTSCQGSLNDMKERYERESPPGSWRGGGGGGGLLSEYLFRLQKDEPLTGRAYKRGAL